MSTECVLCKYAGSTENPAVCMAMNYITESAGRISVPEMSSQVAEALNSALDTTDLTPAQVENHIRYHSIEQRVVLNTILKDLIGIATTVQDNAIIHDEVTGYSAVDNKSLMAYLKTVDQITSIFKMDSMRPTFNTAGAGSNQPPGPK